MPSSALSYLNTIPTVIQPLSGLITEGQRVLVSLLLVPPSRKQQENERKKRGGGENNGWRGVEERKKGRDKEEEEEEEASSNSPVGDFSSVERIYAATYPGWLLNVRSVFSSGLLSFSLSFSPRCLYDDGCTFQRVYTHTRAPARAPLPVHREERSRCKGDPRRF